ncbi:MAG TPA: T9SS type A sorting domain-containing protein [Bacteroidales bacterium]|nr:T9SS type A sorting domain-containing protein [Bacteroidales bacterium]
MKRLIFLLSLISLSTLSAQTILTYHHNGLRPGDTITTQEIEYVEPGSAGENQVWDFSGLKFTGKINTSCLPENPLQGRQGTTDYNVVMKEDDRVYYFSLDDNAYIEQGFTTGNTSIIYSDPIIRLKFPFAYGQTFTDKYLGDAVYCSNSIIPVAGDYTVTADATGTLILPGMIIRDVLRVKTEKNAFQVNPCNITESKVIRYMWYAPGARYPVMGTSYTEHKITSREPQVIKASFINPQDAGLQLVTGDHVYLNHVADYSVVTYPNPFQEKLDYVYLLRKPMKVTVELLDVSGKELFVIESKTGQAEGLHFGELDAYRQNLSMGVYYLRFTFGGETHVSKVVKM